MRLSEGIFFKRINEDVYIKDLNSRQEYILNETAAEILEFIKNGENVEIADIVRHLSGIYNAEISSDDIMDFMQQLAEMNIIDLHEVREDTYAANYVSEQIRELYKNERKIYSASLELTYRCNEKCIHCYVDDDLSQKADELVLDDYKKIIDQLSEMGCVNILLTGGEVCLKADFIEILKYAVSKELLVDVYTNGIALTDELFDEICKLPINTISFSLYGATAETHDMITKVKGSFEKTLKRMMMFKCAGKETYFKTVILEQNKHERKGMLELSKRLGIDIVMASSVLPSHCGIDPDKLRLNDAEEYRKSLELFSQYYPKEKNLNYSRDLDDMVCFCGQNIINIDPYGNVMPCISMPIILGNIKNTSIKDMWENSEKLKEIQALTFRDLDCNPELCPKKDFCEICMGSLYDEKRGKISIRNEFCVIAEAKKNFYS